MAAVRIETMDVEKTMQFLLEQQAVFASRMDELAINLVAIGKAQVRSEQRQERFEKRIEELQVGHEERIRHLRRGSRFADHETRSPVRERVLHQWRTATVAVFLSRSRLLNPPDPCLSSVMWCRIGRGGGFS